MRHRGRAFTASVVLVFTATCLAVYTATALPRRACREYIQGKNLLLEECVTFTPQFHASPVVLSIFAVTLVLLLAVNIFAGETP